MRTGEAKEQLFPTTVIKIKNEKRCWDSQNTLIDCLIGKNMSYDYLSCFNVDSNICFNVNNMDEKHRKSFPVKDTKLIMCKYKQTFMDFTRKKLEEKLSAGNLVAFQTRKMLNAYQKLLL